MNGSEAMRYLEGRGLVLPAFEEVDRYLGTDVSLPIPAFISEEMGPEASLALWSAAREHMPTTRLVPVLLGAEPMIDWASPRRLRQLPERIARNRAAAARPPHAVLARVEARLAKRFSRQVVDRLHTAMDNVRPAWLVRPGAAPPAHDFGGDADAMRFLAAPEPIRCVLLGCAPWESPLYLGLGGWNGSPRPHEQALLLRAWWERHGAQLVHVGRSSVELYAERPAVRIEAMRELLREVLLYCHDAAFQDADDSFPTLRTMLAGNWWTFWWD